MAAATFRIGQKELFLPNVTLTLHRTPKLAPNLAQFTVPLWFNKLDLRDYLFHVYSVRVVSVRSFIKQQRVTQGRQPSDHIHNSTFSDAPSAHRPEQRRWHRPASIKRMIVELERPFVWPKDPADIPESEGGGYGPWQHQEKAMYDKEAEIEQNKMDPVLGKTLPPADDARQKMRTMAQRFLEKKDIWTPGRQMR